MPTLDQMLHPRCPNHPVMLAERFGELVPASAYHWRLFSIVERFEMHHMPEPNSGCWLWIGAVDRGGYGSFRDEESRCVKAHRWSYEHFVGPIPKGLTIDHLCRVPCCVNPDHLEPVTMAENLRRGMSFSAVNARKTHCKHGHPLSGGNVVITYSKDQRHRKCKTCDRLTAQAYRARKKTAKVMGK